MFILKKVIAGLNHLHKNGYMHRDIKGSNILLDSGGNVCIGDLGLAKCFVDKGILNKIYLYICWNSKLDGT